MCIASKSHNSISEPRHSAAMIYTAATCTITALVPQLPPRLSIYRSMVGRSRPTDAWTASLAPYYFRTPYVSPTQKGEEKGDEKIAGPNKIPGE